MSNKLHLLPRWRLENHPLFLLALEELGRAESSEDDALNFNVKISCFKDLLAPKKSGIKYSMLQFACKTLCEKAQYSTDKGWIKAYATVIRMTDTLRQNTDGNFSEVDMPLSQHYRSTILSPRKEKRGRKKLL
eukprot:snap_masked-scaffold_3-processed-gene-17.12-mRNA-1 protein AED:1.00 eAED:1.00 QI:0/0/0/0/1/1/2/0/132